MKMSQRADKIALTAAQLGMALTTGGNQVLTD